MTIEDFIKEVENVAKLYSLKAEILARTKNAFEAVTILVDSMMLMNFDAVLIRSSNFFYNVKSHL